MGREDNDAAFNVLSGGPGGRVRFGSQGGRGHCIAAKDLDAAAGTGRSGGDSCRHVPRADDRDVSHGASFDPDGG
ncbi:hypothetical protein D9M69_674800 [compost metagenome]